MGARLGGGGVVREFALQQIIELSQEFGRKVVVVGRSMVSVTEIAHNLGLLDIPDGILIRPQDAMSCPKSKLTVLISGTQGEPMSALSRVAVDNHKHISVEPGDTVVLSSRIIPGNEKAIARVMNHVARRGAEVLPRRPGGGGVDGQCRL